MRLIPNVIVLAFLATSPTHAADNNIDLTVVFKHDFISFMSSNWDEYSVKEYYTKKPKSYAYLSKTFNKAVLSKSSSIHSKDINIEQGGDTEGGYDLGIITLIYMNHKTANDINSIITHTKTRNLKGGKIFIGYTSKQCGKNVVLLYSRAILTGKIKAYFKHIKNVKC